MRVETITPGTPPVGGWLTDEGFLPLARWTIYVLQGERPILYVPSVGVAVEKEPVRA